MMIHTEAQYQRTRDIVLKTRKKLREQRKEMTARGLTPAQIKRAMDPTRSFVNDMAWELRWYERVRRGDIEIDDNLELLGRTLIGLRLASGMTQAQLAEKLGITQAQVSQDENNEYHGISVDRARKILAVFGARLESKLILPQEIRRKAA
jgi:DNA-binding XRE family transcriptional regulator